MPHLLGELLLLDLTLHPLVEGSVVLTTLLVEAVQVLCNLRHFHVHVLPSNSSDLTLQGSSLGWTFPDALLIGGSRLLVLRSVVGAVLS